MPDKKLVTPRYISRGVYVQAVEVALNAAGSSALYPLLKRQHFHIVVLAPAMEDAQESNYPGWPNYPIQPYVLYQESVGKSDWAHPYDEIAMCKALQLWTDRNDGRAGVIPHLLFPGDTPYWGGVKRDGIVVTCSGVQQWFDRLIAGIVADTIIALAHDAYELDQHRIDGADFLK